MFGRGFESLHLHYNSISSLFVGGVTLFPLGEGELLHVADGIAFVHDFVTHYGFDYVFEGQDTLEATIFVDYYS